VTRPPAIFANKRHLDGCVNNNDLLGQLSGRVATHASIHALLNVRCYPRASRKLDDARSSNGDQYWIGYLSTDETNVMCIIKRAMA